MPYMMTASYLTSYYVWQVHMPYPLWVIFMLSGFVGSASVEINNRLMKNHGVKPMDDIPSKLTYSFVHSTLTNPEIMLIQATPSRSPTRLKTTSSNDWNTSQRLRGAFGTKTVG